MNERLLIPSGHSSTHLKGVGGVSPVTSGMWHLQYSVRSPSLGNCSVCDEDFHTEKEALGALQDQKIRFEQAGFELRLAKLTSPTGKVRDLLQEQTAGLPLTSPWYYARKSGNNYLMPSDIGEAIDAGATKVKLWEEILEAINRDKIAQIRLCAFIALDGPVGGWPSGKEV